MVDYSLVLTDYGSDTQKGRAAYLRQLLADIEEETDVKSEVFGQCIIGGGDFITWVKKRFLEGSETREQPSAGKIKRYREKEAILALIEEETGKDLEAVKMEKGNLRRLVMGLLYRHEGLKGPEIGALFDLHYSAVSQERKRLQERMGQDPKLDEIANRLEGKLSTIKI